MSDYEVGSHEYEVAKAYLANHEALVADIYHEAITCECGCGYVGPGRSVTKHYRFAGKAWTMDTVEKIVRAMGY